MSDSARTRTVREPKLLLPFLLPFYAIVVPLAWPLARLACGFHLTVHGWGKIMRGGTVTGWSLTFGIFLTFIEFVGGICITIGLFTRFFAAAGDRDGVSHVRPILAEGLWLADRRL